MRYSQPRKPAARARTSAPCAVAILAACLFLSACGTAGNATAAEPSVQQLASTIAAATVNAAAAGTATAAVTPTVPSATATIQPTLFINAATSSCRSGPSPDFEVIATYTAGTTVPLVGKDSADSYWVVQDPGSHSDCWISVQDGTPGGSFDTLPDMTPPPVSGAVPGKPAKGAWNFACDNTTLTTILDWRPTTGTVNGYRIFRQGNQIADVPSTQTNYTDKIPFTYGSSMQYSVAAYNEAGMSPQLNWNFHCP